MDDERFKLGHKLTNHYFEEHKQHHMIMFRIMIYLKYGIHYGMKPQHLMKMEDQLSTIIIH